MLHFICLIESQNDLYKFPFLFSNPRVHLLSLYSCTDNLTFYVTPKIEAVPTSPHHHTYPFISLPSYLTFLLSIWINYLCFSLRATLHLCSRSISFTYLRTLFQKFYLHFLKRHFFYYLLNHPHWHTNRQQFLPLQEILDYILTSLS